MKIPESIIEKYQLTPSGEQCGKSHMNLLTVFKSDMPALQPYRFMECDLDGNKSEFITILDVQKQKSVQATREYLEGVTIDAVIEVMNKSAK